ncbi:nitronate monooxygenase [Luteimonas marina]|uniref:Propionate 3-nitronate monooxygenase n=1 Tax=Luteimonas marina TaxID=488485 RepID=A0A5C5UBJ9_9GAMM|nr:nitronate monooxygenase [Luteimonas marina]TWT23319.1 nitronate monooxygenase [Luteimonas marina]
MKAWTRGKVAQRLGLVRPIVQGPFGGGLSSVDLVVAVSEAGGLGSFGAHHLDAAGIAGVAAAIRARTNRPFALNLWLPFEDSDDPPIDDDAYANHAALLAPYYAELGIDPPPRPERFTPRFEDQIEALLDARPAAFSFVFGVPPPAILDRCRTLGIATIGAVTTPDEAIALDRAGVDLIVATGFEAGGHRVSFLRQPEDCLTGGLSLIPQVADAVRAPVIAAGGIADGRGILAALSLGAQAAQIGTAFLACDESNASALHRERLFGDEAKRTGLTRAFSGRLARGLVNPLMTRMRGRENALPPYPVQSWLTGAMRQAAIAQGRADLMPLWAGQSAPLLRHRSASALTAALIDEVEARLLGD